MINHIDKSYRKKDYQLRSEKNKKINLSLKNLSSAILCNGIIACSFPFPFVSVYSRNKGRFYSFPGCLHGKQLGN